MFMQILPMSPLEFTDLRTIRKSERKEGPCGACLKQAVGPPKLLAAAKLAERT